MSGIISIKDNENLLKNPVGLAGLIHKLSVNIAKSKGDLTDLKKRGFFERTFSNNTRDLAEALIKQNDNIPVFLNIVNMIIGFNLHNTVVLGGLYEELNKVSEEANETNNEYFDFAQKLVGEALQTAKNSNEEFEKLNKLIYEINIQLKAEEQIIENQSDAIDLLKQNSKENNELIKRQSEEIKQLKISIQKKEELAATQNTKALRKNDIFRFIVLLYLVLNMVGIIYLFVR